MAAADQIADLVSVMRQLRSECPWDRRQTHQSLVEYLLEEAYEVAEAIDGNDDQALREELGDLLLQVVFHAQIASEQQGWDLGDVAEGIATKLIRRHPHVFADVDVADASEVEANWHVAKAAEKGRDSVTDGIPHALPALLRAAKVESRSAHLDVPAQAQYPWAEEVLAGFDDQDSFGDALSALVAAARDRGWDAEGALRSATSRRIDQIRASE
jgi:XTP/dITP diphosphohydrolase